MVAENVEAEKLYHLQAASQRSRKARGLAWVQVWRPENQRSWRPKFHSKPTGQEPGAEMNKGRKWWVSWLEKNFLFYFLSHLGSQWIRQCQPTFERVALTQSTDSDTKISWKYRDIPVNIAFSALCASFKPRSKGRNPQRPTVLGKGNLTASELYGLDNQAQSVIRGLHTLW